MIEPGPAAETRVAAAPSPARRGRLRFNQSMRLVRRSHMYAGLFMVPWVFLYGATALLFNHPDAFPDASTRRLGPAALAGTPLASLPDPGELAAEVASTLEGSGYRLVRPDEAAFSREVAATARSGGRQYNIRIDLESGEGSAREVAERPKVAPAPFARTGPEAADGAPPLADLEAALPAVLARVGLPESEVNVRTGPELGFLVEGGGKAWKVRYDLTTGALAGQPEDAPGDPLSGRRFLTRLHMAHGYPARLGVRWAWAVAVDLMFVSMIGWGITGLIMWWQMKNFRRVGAVVLALSAVVAAILAVGMHDALVASNVNGRAEAPAAEKPAGRRAGKAESPSPGAPRPDRTP